MDLKRMEARTEAALEDLQPGDRFHEMFSFWSYVIERRQGTDGDWVLRMDASPPCDVPMDGKFQWQRLDDFKVFIRRNSMLVGNRHDVEGWAEEAKLPLPLELETPGTRRIDFDE